MSRKGVARVALGAALCCLLLSAAAWSQAPFVRGDVNCDGVIDALDVNALTDKLFSGTPIPCDDAGDANDDGTVSVADLAALSSFVATGGPIPPPPFPNCGFDPTPDGLGCASACCGVPRDHFKTWRLRPQLVDMFVDVSDQFMRDELWLTGIEYLSNPARKDTFAIIRPDDHLTWYRAQGRDTLLEVEFVNQFGLDTVLIDSVRFLLLPTQKLPHPPPDQSLDHYKAYRIRGSEWFLRVTTLEDQFGLVPDLVDSLRLAFFLTPASKNGEPIHDPEVHYVAYEITPKRIFLDVRDLIDQFGAHTVQVEQSDYLLVPTLKLSVTAPTADTLRNHFKSWRLDNFPFSGTAQVQDQFMNDLLVLDSIEFLANPAHKDTSDIKRPDDHLLWYQAEGRDTLLWVAYQNQFGVDTLIIDSVTHLLVPCQKLPHAAPDSLLGRYKAYRVRNGQTYFDPTGIPVMIEDQFDPGPIPADSLVPVYFLTPATKNTEPIPHPDTHYVVYEIFPKTDTLLFKTTVDQFGTYDLTIRRSELLLVPTHKMAYGSPGEPETSRNHFKTWRVEEIPFTAQVDVVDPFMSDQLVLNGPVFLSNPAIKDTSDIKRPDDHLNWYRASGRDTLLEIVYSNQFGLDTVEIDSVTHLLVPCQKLPHEPPDSVLGHYKSYRIRNGQSYRHPDGSPIQVEDQFDANPEFLDSVLPVLFLTPAIKNDEPGPATDTHYVVYEIFPKTNTELARTTIDQFGTWDLVIQRSVFLLVPTQKISDTPPPPDSLENHFKGWRLIPTPFDTAVFVQDQFMSDSMYLKSINFICNPTRKDTFAIVKPDDHLMWYGADGRDTCLEIVYENQFGLDTFLVGTASHLVLPAQKLPHPPPDPLLDHYKAYKVYDPQPFIRTTEMQDQFDLVPQFIDTLLPKYYCTPASKNLEPIHNPDLHYVAYEFFPKHDTAIVRTTIDQFGSQPMTTRRGELLLVPTEQIHADTVCPIVTPGDVNCDGVVTAADVIALVNYVFKGGIAPCP